VGIAFLFPDGRLPVGRVRPLARVTLVEGVRARLAAWPQAHFGYRQDEAVALLSMLDEVLMGLRAAAGEQRFSLTLTAGTPPAPPPAPVLRTTATLQDVVRQVLAVSPHLANAAEREALLTHALASVRGAEGTWDPTWRKAATRDLERRLDVERRATRAYAALRTRTLQRAERLVASADVRGLITLRDDVRRRDTRLGELRPGEMVGLLAYLEQQLDDARRYRLALDRWEARRPALDAFAGAMRALLGQSTLVIDALDDVRTLAGPPLDDLDRAYGVLTGVEVAVAQLQAPDEARALHGLLTSFLQMATQALQRRRAATVSGNLSQAWDASAAAAGALLLVDRMRDDLPALTQRPSSSDLVASATR